jgi:prepilin-type N-terminal cleavage/methylation domain-containing protein
MLKQKKYKAFTLVELIVVIVILAILATIAFLSFSSQSSSARDSTRLADMSNIAKWLSVFNATAWNYPAPDNAIIISASWITIWKQWYAGNSVLNMIKISNWGKDPLDTGVYYTYSVNSNTSKFQILGFLEDWSSTALSLSPGFAKFELKSAFAEPSTYSWRYMITKWDWIWILLNSTTMLPIQTAWTWVDLIKSNSNTVYKAIFWSEVSWANLTVSWTTIFSNIVNRNSDLIKDKTLAPFDDSLIWYWDMDSYTSTITNDLSKYWNTWILSGTTLWAGKIWKSRSFNWINEGIIINNSTSISPTKWISMAIWFKWNYNWAYNWLLGKMTTLNQSSYLLQMTPTGPCPAWSIQATYWHSSNLNDWVCTPLWYWDNLWHHAVATIDTFIWKTKIFIDGSFIVAKQNAAGEDILTNSNPLIIGGRYDQTVPMVFPWLIDEVRIYNRALSDSEIQTLYNSTK